MPGPLRAMLLLGVFFSGCAASKGHAPPGTGGSHPPATNDAAPPAPADGGSGGSGGTGGGGGMTGDPFAPLPDESGGLTNVSADLDTVLEHGQLAGACDRYQAGQTDRHTMLLCGKWMFFYDSFNTSGIPAVLVKFMAKNFPDQLGLGFEKLGMVADPSSADSLPLGIAPTVKLQGKVDALAFTCASCHFAKLADGRYAVGAPNHSYEYGKHILSIALFPTIGLGLSQASAHDANAVAAIQPLLDALAANPSLKTQLSLQLLSLSSLGSTPAMTKDDEHAYATWPSGALDFNMAPLPVDDGVEIVGKMSPLWDMPRPDEIASSGMASAMLGWTGDTPDLIVFLQGFATFGQATAPTPASLTPLVEYIYSLRAPSNPSPPDASLVATGRQLFFDKHCSDCHDGPRGSGKRVYTFQEIGTDGALARWLDPMMTGQPCCGVTLATGQTLSHGVKSPRLTGLWALQRFLHNGSLASLDQLFCLGAGRPAAGVEPDGTNGHDFTCTGLTDDDKRALEAYLLAH